MSCFFCNSDFHVSQSCELYDSDIIRQEIASANRCCRYCLTSLEKIHETLDCVGRQRCYICLSKSHHSVFCPDRFEASKLFIPKIDNILFLRFCQMFDLIERYFFAFLSPKTSTITQLLPLKIFENFNNESYTRFSGFNVTSNILIKDLKLTNIPGVIFDRRISNASHFTIISIELVESVVSTNELLKHLLSQHTKIFKCHTVKFSSKVTFAEMLERLPNIERIFLNVTNMKIEDSWPEDLLKFKSGNNFKELTITITSVNFNVESLVKFMATKCIKNVKIYLYVSLEKNLHQASANLQASLLSIFDAVESVDSNDDKPLLTIRFRRRSVFDVIPYPALMYTLKNLIATTSC